MKRNYIKFQYLCYYEKVQFCPWIELILYLLPIKLIDFGYFAISDRIETSLLRMYLRISFRTFDFSYILVRRSCVIYIIWEIKLIHRLPAYFIMMTKISVHVMFVSQRDFMINPLQIALADVKENQYLGTFLGASHI